MFLTIPEHHNRKLEPLYSRKIERGNEEEDKKEKKKGEEEEEEEK